MPNQETNELSERELEILKLVATGASNKEIARKLFISSNTVKVHLRNIFSKINTASRTEAAMYAVRIGLVENISPQISTQEDGVRISNDLGFSTDSSLPISQENILPKPVDKKRLIGSITLAIAVITLVILGSIYIPGNIIQAYSSIHPTSTPQVQWFKLLGPPTPRKGLAVTSYENKIFAIGGESSQGITNTIEMYNPQIDVWSECTPKPVPVTDIGAGLIGGLIYVPGGKQINGLPTNKTEIYDPNTNQWISGVPMPKPLSGYGLVVFEGRIYIFGGWDGKQILNNAYEFDPQIKKWTEISPLPSARSYPGVIVVGSKIYIIGGWDGQKSLTTSDIYLPDASLDSQWIEGPSLPSGRFGMGITNLADIIFIIGGTSSSDDLLVIALSQEDKEWGQVESPLPNGWSFLGATTIGTRIYMLGGSTNEGFITDSWSYQAIFTIILPIIH
jgi:DNA-binding CsgD family transcriptional regulator/N-acetylneuraminic acid mutarotase